MRPLVMIVDDESDIRGALFDFLDDYDEFRLMLAESAEAALGLLQQESADLCIVDMRLPGMNGKEFIREASVQGLCSHFLLHTGSIDDNLDKDLKPFGLTKKDLLLKPCDNWRILDRIRALIG